MNQRIKCGTPTFKNTWTKPKKTFRTGFNDILTIIPVVWLAIQVSIVASAKYKTPEKQFILSTIVM